MLKFSDDTLPSAISAQLRGKLIGAKLRAGRKVFGDVLDRGFVRDLKLVHDLAHTTDFPGQLGCQNLLFRRFHLACEQHRTVIDRYIHHCRKAGIRLQEIVLDLREDHTVGDRGGQAFFGR